MASLVANLKSQLEFTGKAPSLESTNWKRETKSDKKELSAVAIDEIKQWL